MAWTVKFSGDALKQLKKLDAHQSKRIINYLTQRVLSNSQPRSLGKELSGNLSPLWRYRVGDFRMICELKDDILVVLVLKVGHRKNVYKR